MKNENNVPYERVSDGVGQDIPEQKHGDAPWFRRPDPLYFPGYFFPSDAALMGMPGFGVPGVNGLLESISERMERDILPKQ